MQFTIYHALFIWLAAFTAAAAPQESYTSTSTPTSSVTPQPTSARSNVTGQACSYDSDCPINEYCFLGEALESEVGSCEPLSTNGETCEADDQCWSLQCEATSEGASVCVGREEGAPCWENSQCASDCCQPGPRPNGLAYCGTTDCVASCFA